MEAFWPRILIMLGVIILGIVFVSTVSDPQNEMQSQLGVTHQQGMEIIKEQSKAATMSSVSGTSVKSYIDKNSGRSDIVIQIEGKGVSNSSGISESSKYTQTISCGDNGKVTYNFSKQG